MRSRHAVFGRRIARFALTVAVCELSLAGHAALQSRANFLARCLFERISTASDEGESSERTENG
jgi:hypothetical protein